MKRLIFIFCLILVPVSLFAYPQVLDVFYPPMNTGYVEECFRSEIIVYDTLSFDELPKYNLNTSSKSFYYWNENRNVVLPIEYYYHGYIKSYRLRGKKLINFGPPISLLSNGQTESYNLILDSKIDKSVPDRVDIVEGESTSYLPYLPLVFEENGSRIVNPNLNIVKESEKETIFKSTDGQYEFIYRIKEGYFQELVKKDSFPLFSRWIAKRTSLSDGTMVPIVELIWTIESKPREIYVKQTTQIIEGDFGPFTKDRLLTLVENIAELIEQERNKKNYGNSNNLI